MHAAVISHAESLAAGLWWTYQDATVETRDDKGMVWLTVWHLHTLGSCLHFNVAFRSTWSLKMYGRSAMRLLESTPPEAFSSAWRPASCPRSWRFAIPTKHWQPLTLLVSYNANNKSSMVQCSSILEVPLKGLSVVAPQSVQHVQNSIT